MIPTQICSYGNMHLFRQGSSRRRLLAFCCLTQLLCFACREATDDELQAFAVLLGGSAVIITAVLVRPPPTPSWFGAPVILHFFCY